MNQGNDGDVSSAEGSTGHGEADSATRVGIGGVDRRKALQRIGLVGGVAGAAWAAPSIIGGFDNPAGAAQAISALKCNTPSNGVVTVPANRVLFFDLGGGGGGGGSKGTSKNGGPGGSGANVTGTIAAMATYTVTTSVGMRATWTLP